MFAEPYLQIRSNTIFQYNLAPRIPRSVEMKNLLSQHLRQQNTYSGTLTPGAKKRLTKAIEFLMMATKHQTIVNPVTSRSQPFRLSFITLTVSETERNLTGKEAHSKLLEPFLQWMRRVHNVNMYVWKAELQKRGQIHYHITGDTFIHWREIQNKWNELQKNAGYLENFFKKYGHYKPNSTDVHSVRKMHNMGGYLLKEIVKSFQNEKSLGGKVWDCSMNIKASKYYTTIADSCYSDKLELLIKEKKCKFLATDHCTIYRIIDRPAHEVLTDRDKAEFMQHIDNVRGVVAVPVKPKAVRKKEIVYDIEPVRAVRNREIKMRFASNIDNAFTDLTFDGRLFSSS